MRNKPRNDDALTQIARRVEQEVPDRVTHAHFDGGSAHEQTTELRIRARRIAIGLPMDELMFSQFFVNYVGLDTMPWDSLLTTTSTYLPMARNQIHTLFLNKTEASHLLMLDSDVLPPPRLIEKLLSHNKDMVGGWYSKKEKYGVKDEQGNVKVIQRPVVYDYLRSENGVPLYAQRTYPGAGVESVDGAGAGCWLMSRKVAAALGEAPYGQDPGEDLVLCKKVKDLGFEMFVDWSIHCAHVGCFYV